MFAEVAELADAQASGACGSNIVWVQVPSSAYKRATPIRNQPIPNWCRPYLSIPMDYTSQSIYFLSVTLSRVKIQFSGGLYLQFLDFK